MLEKFQEILGYSDKIVYKTSNKKSIILFMKILLTVILLTVLINRFLIFKVNVPTASMVPTLNVNDKLLAGRVHNLDTLKFGDIVVFYSEELDEYMVKRLIGLPGDFILIDKGTLYVNREYKRESYVQYGDDYSGAFKVPEGEYFFLGDNRPVSLDSRLWEETFIKEENIIGIVKFKMYPLKDIGSIK